MLSLFSSICFICWKETSILIDILPNIVDKRGGNGFHCFFTLLENNFPYDLQPATVTDQLYQGCWGT